MPLETGTYISDLVVTNPTSNDPKSQGDDHVRFLKTTIKNTFPNINGAITKTDEQINNLAQAGVNTDIASIAGNAATATNALNPAFSTAAAASNGEAQIIAKVTGQNDVVIFNNSTRWGAFSSSGGLAFEYNRAESKLRFYGNSASLGSGGATGTPMVFYYQGQAGQPLWVWGSNSIDGSQNFVWNPSNFRVAYAADAGYAANAGYANSAGGTIGIGQSWQEVTGSRAISTNYWNTTGRPIQVNVVVRSQNGGSFGGVLFVNDSSVSRFASYTANPGYQSLLTAIVPPNHYCRVEVSSTGGTPTIDNWLELR